MQPHSIRNTPSIQLTTSCDLLPPGHYLGVLCLRAHEYLDTGKSERSASGHCVACNRLKTQRHVERKHNDPEFKSELNNKARVRYARNAESYRERDRRYKAINRDRILESAKRQRAENHEHFLELDRAKRDRNREKMRQTDRNWKRRWRAANPERARQVRKERYQRNPLLIRLRTRLRRAFVDYSSGGKTRSADEYGIDYAAILVHIGPCPGDPREWHIDHIRPLCSFDWDDPVQIIQAFAPENHQWLPAHDNLVKQAKYG